MRHAVVAAGLALAATAFAQPGVVSAPPLRVVRLSGHSAISEADLQARAQAHLGQPASEDTLEALRQDLTRLYVERGYVNSGVLVRAVSGDTVDLHVVEGRVSGMTVRGLDGLSPDYVVQRLQRPDDGPLRLDVLRERFALLAADPLFASIQARVLPGDRLGEAVLDVTAERARAWQVGWTLNNYRPVSVGAAATALTARVFNLIGRGDVFDASVQVPVPHGANPRVSLGWRVPLDARGRVLAFAAIERGQSLVTEAPVAALDIRSRLASEEAGLQLTLTETLNLRASTSVSLMRRESRAWLLDMPFAFTAGEPGDGTRERLLRWAQELQLRDPQQALALRSVLIWGHNNLMDPAAAVSAGASAAPAQRFFIWQAQAQYTRQWAVVRGAQWVLRAALQRSPQHLLALDAMPVGGVQTVRGFRENTLVRDQALVLNAELEWPVLADPDSGARAWLIPFVDHGRALQHGAGGSTLQSAGLAARAQWHGWQADIAWAHRLRQPDTTRPSGANLQDRGVLLQVGYRY